MQEKIPTETVKRLAKEAKASKVVELTEEQKAAKELEETFKAEERALKDFSKSLTTIKPGDIVKDAAGKPALVVDVCVLGFTSPIGFVRENSLDLKVVRSIEGRMVSSFMSSKDVK